ncbi:MAG: SIMPL domain-containing protein [Gemmatimonadaceae bacterium]
MENRSLLYGLIALGIALGFGSCVVGRGLGEIRRPDEAITVTGSAKRPIRADFVVWRSALSMQSPSISAASNELRTQATRVRQFFRSNGVADSMLTIKPVETFAVPEVLERGQESGRIVAYRLTQQFEVRSSDVDALTALSQKAGDLMSEGVALSSQPPEYLYTKLADLRVALIEDATRDAKARAEAIAKSTGSGIGTVRQARIGVFQITPRFSTEISDYGLNDVSAIEKDVTAVVHVTFALR